MTTIFNASILVLVAFMLALGQIFLKSGVHQVQTSIGDAGVLRMFSSLIFTWQFWTAILVSGAVMVLWAWVLTFIPLSKAYPFVVLAFVFTALLEGFAFGTGLSPKFFLGCGLILAGLVVIVK